MSGRDGRSRDTGLRLRVDVASAANPHLLRAAIERRLAGRRFGDGPEDAVGEAVARAVLARLEPRREAPWR